MGVSNKETIDIKKELEALQTLFKQEGVSEGAQKATIRVLMRMFKEYADLGVKYMELVEVLLKEGENKDGEWESSSVN